jgi:hypothetical protein
MVSDPQSLAPAELELEQFESELPQFARAGLDNLDNRNQDYH